MQIRIKGEWKEYDVQITAGGEVISEELQRDWSLHLMRWVRTIRIEHYCDLNCKALFGYYYFDDMIASDMLFYRENQPGRWATAATVEQRDGKL